MRATAGANHPGAQPGRLAALHPLLPDPLLAGACAGAAGSGPGWSLHLQVRFSSGDCKVLLVPCNTRKEVHLCTQCGGSETFWSDLNPAFHFDSYLNLGSGSATLSVLVLYRSTLSPYRIILHDPEWSILLGVRSLFVSLSGPRTGSVGGGVDRIFFFYTIIYVRVPLPIISVTVIQIFFFYLEYAVMWIWFRWIRIMGGWLDPDPYGEIRIWIQDI